MCVVTDVGLVVIIVSVRVISVGLDVREWCGHGVEGAVSMSMRVWYGCKNCGRECGHDSCVTVEVIVLVWQWL